MQNILVMGLGRGRLLALAAKKSSSIRLAGVIDPNPDRLRAVGEECGLSEGQRFSSLDEAIAKSKADILVVATPTPLHAQHVVAGLNAGLHVLCEKPLAADRNECLRMRDASRRTKRQLAVVQNTRYGAHFRKCQQLIKQGVIGDLISLQMRFHRCRQRKANHPHVLLFNHGVHHLDVIRFVTGATAKRIDAVEWDPASSPGEGRCLRVTITTEQGYVIGYDASYAEGGQQTPQPGELRISGTKGSLEAFGEFEDPQLWLSQNQKTAGQDSRQRIPVEPVGWDEIDQNLLENFARGIEDNHVAETDVEDNLLTLDWLFRAASVLDDGKQN